MYTIEQLEAMAAQGEPIAMDYMPDGYNLDEEAYRDALVRYRHERTFLPQLLDTMRENAEMKRQRDAILAISPPFSQDSYAMAWFSIRQQVKKIFNGGDAPTQPDAIEILSKRLHITVEALDEIAMRYSKEDFAWVLAVEAIKQAEQYEAETLAP